MQLYLIDLDLISTMTYQGNWTEKYVSCKVEMAKKGEYGLKLNVSEKFTSIISNRDRIYTFGGD